MDNSVSIGTIITFNIDAEFRWYMQYPNIPESILKPLIVQAQNSMNCGIPRLLDILKAKQIKATFFVSAMVASKYSNLIKLIVSEGHEIGCLGYKSENYGILSKEEQKRNIVKSKKVIEEIIDQKVYGFRASDGELTKNTFRILKELNFKYSSNLFDDYFPYSLNFDGEESLLEIPSSWSLCDMPYFIANLTPSEPAGQCRIPNYDSVLTNYKWEVEGYQKVGGISVFQFNPQVTSTVGKVGIFEKLMDYIIDKKNIQVASCREFYDSYYKEKNA